MKLIFIFVIFLLQIGKILLLTREFDSVPKNSQIPFSNGMPGSKKPMKIRGEILCHYWNARPEEKPWGQTAVELWATNAESHIRGDDDHLLGATRTSLLDGDFWLIQQNRKINLNGLKTYLIIRHDCWDGGDGLGENCTYVTRRLLDSDEAAGKKKAMVHIGRIFPLDSMIWGKYKYKTAIECDD